MRAFFHPESKQIDRFFKSAIQQLYHFSRIVVGRENQEGHWCGEHELKVDSKERPQDSHEELQRFEEDSEDEA